jgi:UDP-N-acetylglucosamine diphosphorylase / glucose-1-phosphate thymidylyltransferase / UDP-N-acetylgalactosamine diphosphorylase / glucosamine-1-phosphate N-acetyltransferase / galactosamine-1-phosphate N-acetyltransferase
VPDWPAGGGASGVVEDVFSGVPSATREDSRPVMVGGEVCGWYSPASTDRPSAELLADPTAYALEGRDPVHLPGRVLRHAWELVTQNAEQVTRDIEALFPMAGASRPPLEVLRIGSAPFVVGDDVLVEPGVVLDLREGPIWLDDGVKIQAFTRLAGPAYVGRGTTVLGGALAEVSIGPQCKVRGEIEAAVILGYSNKAHDGFLGHAYLGRWVNLGAMTTNSDLKNNYGSIRLQLADGEVDTGEMKLGCLLGDHVKTAIGTFLNTGTIVGAGSNIFGAAPPGRWTPPFSWGTTDPAQEYDLSRFLATAEAVMARRNVRLSSGQRELLRQAWQRGRRSS